MRYSQTAKMIEDVTAEDLVNGVIVVDEKRAYKLSIYQCEEFNNVSLAETKFDGVTGETELISETFESPIMKKGINLPSVAHYVRTNFKGWVSMRIYA